MWVIYVFLYFSIGAVCGVLRDKFIGSKLEYSHAFIEEENRKLYIILYFFLWPIVLIIDLIGYLGKLLFVGIDYILDIIIKKNS